MVKNLRVALTACFHVISCAADCTNREVNQSLEGSTRHKTRSEPTAEKAQIEKCEPRNFERFCFELKELKDWKSLNERTRKTGTNRECQWINQPIIRGRLSNVTTLSLNHSFLLTSLLFQCSWAECGPSCAFCDGHGHQPNSAARSRWQVQQQIPKRSFKCVIADMNVIERYYPTPPIPSPPVSKPKRTAHC